MLSGNPLTIRGPWAGRYSPAAVMVVLLLVPYLALAAAMRPISPFIRSDLHMSSQTFSLATGLANAGYAVGTILALALAFHFPGRRVLVVYAGLLFVGAILTATAPGAGLFMAGLILMGLFTGLLLIAAVPPLVIGFPAARTHPTVVVLNICFFGAVAAGPLVGGAQAHFHAWRPLFGIVAGIAALALALSLLTFRDTSAIDRGAPWDPAAPALAAAGCVAAFWGASELTSHAFLDLAVAAPLFGGLALLFVLFVYEFHRGRPLLFLRPLLSTAPVAGTVIALCAAASAVPAIVISNMAMAGRFSPLHLGLLYVPELAGAVVAALIFGAVFRTRIFHAVILAGMLLLAAGILVIGAIPTPTSALTLVGSGIIGLGLGATVIPALFLAGFSLANTALPRVFAAIGMMRAIASFLAAPIIAHFALNGFGGPRDAMRIMLWTCFGLVVLGMLVAGAVPVLGGFRFPALDLERFLASQGPGWESPPLFARLRLQLPSGVPPKTDEKLLANQTRHDDALTP